MRNVVVTGRPRADLGDVDALAAFGVATVHEAEKESESRAAFGRSELGLDRYGLRAVLAEHGVEYVGYQACPGVPQ